MDAADNDKAINRRIGQRLKMVRTQQKLSPKWLSKQVHSDARLIRQFESGDAVISAAQLARLSKELDMPIDFFVQESPLLDWMAEWRTLSLLRQLEPRQRLHVIQLMLDLIGDIPINTRS